MDHLPECVIAEISAHFISWMIDECICDRLVACEERVISAAVDRVKNLAKDMSDWSSDETRAVTDVVPELTADQWIWAQRGVLRTIAALQGDQP